MGNAKKKDRISNYNVATVAVDVCILPLDSVSGTL